MKKILIISAAILALAGCAKETAQIERTTVDGKEYMTFKVVINDDVVSADTKATVSRGGEFGWEDGDPVYFVDNDGTTAEGVFSESASTITVEAGDWIAASTARFTTKNQLNFNNVKGPVIAAQVSGGELHFHYVGSVINVKLASIPYNCKLSFYSHNSEQWADGAFSFNAGGVPSLNGEGTTGVYITKEVTPADAGKDIALSVPNLNYSKGFTINLEKGSNTFLRKWTDNGRDLRTSPTLLNMAQIEAQTLTVAGNEIEVFGNTWAPADTNNDLELGEDGVWRISYPYTPLTYMTFKVVLDHDWSVSSWGKKNSSDNYSATSLTVGKKTTISFTFNDEISVDQFDTYTVLGSDGLCGISWDNDENWESTCVNDMEEVRSGVWNKVFTSVPAGDYEFKVAKNHSWSESWGYLGGSSNVSFTTTSAGNVDVFYYAANNFVRVAGISDTFRIAGDKILFGSSWGAADDNNLMEIQDNGTYKKSYVIPDEMGTDYDLELKVTRDGTWWSPGENYLVKDLSKGQVLTIYFNPVTSEISHRID